ncbi:MAG TPA: glycosyltransferase [Thermoplasmatales archaeon]|nr:glycosyltransferase [Thermoplasmatales archaeon]
MRVNFIVENNRGLKYLGCSTASIHLYNTLKKKGVDVYLNARGEKFDILHAHTFGPLALSQKKKAHISIISAHSTPSINIGNIITGDRRFWRGVYRRIYNSFDYVLAVSNTSIDELRDIGVTKPIYVLENGVDRNLFKYDKERGEEFRKEHGFSEEDFVVLNVAQVTPRKGVYDFIEVARRNPDIKFIWIGGFPYLIASSDYLKLRVLTRNPPPNIVFTGFVEDIIGAYSGADILFAPTYRETFGLTILEALSCNLPVLVRPLRVFKELFNEEILYGNNIEEFSRILSNKPRERYISSLPDKYDLDRIADKLINIYEELT